MSPEKIAFYASLQYAADRRHANKGKLPVQNTATRAPSSRQVATGNKRPTLGPIETAFNNQGREETDEHVAHCIYANGLAFNLVCSPYWQ